MKTVAQLDPLITRLREIHQLNSAAALASWDQETYMPTDGGYARAELLATLQGLAHEALVAPDTERLLAPWVHPASNEVLDAPDAPWDTSSRALLRETWREFSLAKKLPSEFVRRLHRECSLAQQVWQRAKERNDWSSFLPHLRTIVVLKREEAEYRGYRMSPYDALLDLYEPGMTVLQLTELFASLKARLVPMLKNLMHSPAPITDGMLFEPYDTARQLEFGRFVLTAMGYNFTRGRMDLSAHPFTTSFHPTDVRITTRVHETDLGGCLFSCLHEGGHALYDQGLPAQHYGTPLGEAVSLGIHESQSRLWENCVGRSKAFWRCFYPFLQRTFPKQLTEVSEESFYAAVNRVKPSLIRVDADELTYNLHVMLRFELERELIENRIQVDDLPALWNEKMLTYFGIVPERDADGILQDVHWSMGAFGYFPTYALGNLYAVQFYDQARAEILDLEQHISKGHLEILTGWLRQKIHQWGRQFTAEQLVQRVTGRALDSEPFLRYLESKVVDIYG